MYMPLNNHPEKRKLQDHLERRHIESHSFFEKHETWTLKHRFKTCFAFSGYFPGTSCSPQKSLCFLTSSFNSLNKLARSGTRYDEAHVGDFLLSELHLISS